jgi:hypothetical protein
MTDAQEHANHENGLTAQSNLRGVIKALTPDFGDRIASTIATPELLNWLRRQAAKREWADGTYNHYIIQLKVIYRIGQESGKVEANPRPCSETADSRQRQAALPQRRRN